MATQPAPNTPGEPRQSVEIRPATGAGEHAGKQDLKALAELINSGELARAISAANDDPDLAV